MTIFAVMIAGLFPFIHLGRVWLFYWIIPYPNQRTLWPNFQSPLTFDFLAISTYFTVSVLFWYTGLVPDLAAVRDGAKGIRRKIYGLLSLGWAGTDRQWHHYGAAYLLLAGLATPARLVHSVVSWILPRSIPLSQHDLRPYFVWAVLGLAMVLLTVPLRHIFSFREHYHAGSRSSPRPPSNRTDRQLCLPRRIFHGLVQRKCFEKQTFLFRAIGH
jgi:molybdopterin-containing oxidoreductase family membrane subunit